MKMIETTAISKLSIPALIDRASNRLLAARTSAELLEVRDWADLAYTAAKKATLLLEAKGAFDDVREAARNVQADALRIISRAQIRLADEYDAAQERGELATGRDGPGAGISDGKAKATVADVGIISKDIHTARQVRDAERASPGIVDRRIDEMLAEGTAPTKVNIYRTALRSAKVWDAPAKIRSEHGSRTCKIWVGA